MAKKHYKKKTDFRKDKEETGGFKRTRAGRIDSSKERKPIYSKGAETSLDIDSRKVFEMQDSVQKSGITTDLLKNLSSVNTLGTNPAGVEMNIGNLTIIKRAETLPLFGNNTPYKQLGDVSVGSPGFIPNNLVEEMKYTEMIKPVDAVKDPYSIKSAIALSPMAVEKKIMHNYRLVSPDFIPLVDKPQTLLESLYAEDIRNIQLTFVDTMGTDFAINKLTVNRDKTLPKDAKEAFGYISKLFDTVLLKAMRLPILYKK